MPRIQTPTEEKILKDIAAAEARGEDPLGDDEELVAETVEDQAAIDAKKLEEEQPETPPKAEKPSKKAIKKAKAVAEDAVEALAAEADTDAVEDDVTALAKAAGIELDEGPDDESEDGEDEGGEDDDIDAAAAAEPETPEEGLPRIDLAKLDADRKQVRTEKAAAHQKLMDGEISDADYQNLIAPLDDKLEAISDQRAVAVVEERAREVAWKKSIDAIIKQGKVEKSIDYVADTDAQVEFDAAWRSIAASSKVALSPAQLHAKAHATVLALRGIGKARASAAAAPDPKKVVPPARPAPKGVVTLRNLPNASVPNAGGDAKTALARLPGDKFQKAFSQLTEAQKNALTSTDD